MGRYEELLLNNKHLLINDLHKLPAQYDGFYSDGVVLIDKDLSSTKKLETLAEEIAHHKITYGNIVNPNNVMNKKYELKARRLANEMLISLNDIIRAFKHNIHNLYELANFFEVSEEFVLNTLDHYKQKYGLNTRYGDYLIYFEPLRVFEYKKI